MDFINRIFRGDRVIWMIFMLLCLISIVEVYSATSTLAYRRNYWEPIMRHSSFLLAGAGLVLLFHSIKPKYLSLIGLCLPLTWILLGVTKFFGTKVNGADRWLSIAGISFQPSEFAKLSLIILTAFLLSRRKDDPKDTTFKRIMWAAIPTCGIIFIDNFSTAAMLFGIIFLMMFIGQIPWNKLAKVVLYLTLSLSILIASLVFLSSDTIEKVFHRGVTWKERIKDYTYKDNVANEAEFIINDDNYQVSHAKIAIARGGVLGKLPGNSQQRDFLPQAYSDFIFAIIIEELGLMGGALVLSLYIMLFIRSGMIAKRCDKKFSKFLVIGCALLIVCQALANMAVAVNLIPVTGQPLPLISRGGTSTVVTCIYIGIILSVSRFENPKGIKEEEDFAREIEPQDNADLDIENEPIA